MGEEHTQVWDPEGPKTWLQCQHHGSPWERQEPYGGAGDRELLV